MDRAKNIYNNHIKPNGVIKVFTGRQLLILSYIIGKHGETTSAFLSATLGVSTRTIKAEIKNTIEKSLLEIKAAGVNLNLFFQYKMQVGSYICGISQAGTEIQLYIEEILIDDIFQNKGYETGISESGVIGMEGIY